MRLKLLLSVFLFVLTALLLSFNLDKPFWGEHDWNGVRYGNIARNYLRYGLVETKLGQVENSGLLRREEFEYFTHYPPLLPLLISLSYKTFGISEWSTRLIPLLATSGSIVLIFLIGSLLWSKKLAVMAAFLALVTPLVLYFGKNPVHEPLVVFFVLLAYFGYLKSLKALFISGLIFAEASTWAGYFLVPAITLVALLRKDFTQFKRIMPYWILSVAVFLIHLGHTAALTGQPLGGDLLGAMLQRSGHSQQGQLAELTIFNYLDRVRLWFFTLYTTTLTLLSLIWLVSKKIAGFRDQDWVVITLGVFGLIYLLIFPNSAFIHNYLVFYSLPFLALAGSLEIQELIRWGGFKRYALVIPLLFLTAVAFERRSFLQALWQSDADHFAVKVGKTINQQTQPDEVVSISPLQFSYSADQFLKFYGDRKLVYSDSDSLQIDAKVLIDQTTQKFEIIKRK